ncbi:GPI mannosyltransferase 1-like [Saccostrea echinata]|uniref:GPI mannosyltransferase 1-like n=1 Tax=Saccostrea echinata TaxID=191078 RepID=UPI002A82FA2C|nr:GPI mannosyltransferase 1-like [Saccostrea echinata]
MIPRWDIRLALGLGLFIRLTMILYGEWQDRTSIVKYTDVDYIVFTDAAEYMTQGSSPYNRSTYRYTPILAWMLQPNITISPLFGKLLFVMFDVLCGYLIYALLMSENTGHSRSLFCASIWLFNPISIAVSSRGNAESIMSFIVLLTLKLFQQNEIVLGAASYALSVHVKIYPLTYCLALYLYYSRESQDSQQSSVMFRLQKMLWPTKENIVLVLISTVTFLLLTGLCYQKYGWDFLHETYLYHITRRDLRHNFSVYFYMLYLTSDSPYSRAVGLAAFLPQLILFALCSFKFYRDPPMSFFLNTFIFVTFNKVCTSQYFLWYLCLLPLVLPSLTMSIRKGISLIVLWLLGQGMWLLPAYLLEFEGMNTFLFVWFAGILFFLINILVIAAIIDSYKYTPWGQDVKKLD